MCISYLVKFVINFSCLVGRVLRSPFSEFEYYFKNTTTPPPSLGSQVKHIKISLITQLIYFIPYSRHLFRKLFPNESLKSYNMTHFSMFL